MELKCFLVWHKESTTDASRYKAEDALHAKRQHVKARSYRVAYETSELIAEQYENSTELNVLLALAKGKEASPFLEMILTDSIPNERDMSDE